MTQPLAIDLFFRGEFTKAWSHQISRAPFVAISRAPFVAIHGNYEPANCRWATRKQQARNWKHRNKLFPTPANHSPFLNGLNASEYLGRLLGIESTVAGLSIEPSQLILSEPAQEIQTDCSRPLVIELFAGSFGWSAGFIGEGFRSIGFDIEHQDYHGPVPKHATLALKDVLGVHGSWFKNASCLVCSPPCQEYSYMAMPWSRAKAIAAEYRSGARDVKKLTALFDACFRIQREAIEAAGHFIPMVVENVRGAQPWVGKANWNFGSYYLWGDVPALMPITQPRRKSKSGSWDQTRENYNPDKTWDEGTKLPGNNIPRLWSEREVQRLCDAGQQADGIKVASAEGRRTDIGNGARFTSRDCDGVKGFTPNGERLGKNVLGRMHGSKSKSRKAASATIAKIPFALASWIARVYFPRVAIIYHNINSVSETVMAAVTAGGS